VKDRVAYLIFRVLAAGFGALPEPVMRRLGLGIGYAASFASKSKMAMLERHMRRVLGPGANTKRAARTAFASYGRYWAETFWIRPRRLNQLFRQFDVTGWPALNAAKATGRGIVFALPHMGNWEIAGARAAREGLQPLAVAEALPNRDLADWFIDVRTRMGIDVVLTEEGSGVTKQLIRHLKAGGTVALVADRDLGGRGVPVEFFGERTTLPAGPIALADRTGATVLTIATLFRDGAGHRMDIHEAIEIPGRFEEIIRAAPTQWHLLQPNWPSDREASSG
jgi:KDO2-lipid IV(A) lauroyltransferase